METVEKLMRKQKKHEWRKGRKDLKVAQNLRHAKEALAKAIALAEDVATLYDWLREDILAVNGLSYPVRQELFDFVVDQLQARQAGSPARLASASTALAAMAASTADPPLASTCAPATEACA